MDAGRSMRAMETTAAASLNLSEGQGKAFDGRSETSAGCRESSSRRGL